MSNGAGDTGIDALEFYIAELRDAMLHVRGDADAAVAHLVEMCRGVLIAWDTENEPEPD